MVAHPSIFRMNLLKEQNFRCVGIKVTKEEMEKNGSEWILDSQPRKLMEGITTTGEIPKGEKVDFKKEVTLGLYTIEDSILVKDERLDDVSLAIQNEEDLIIISG